MADKPERSQPEVAQPFAGSEILQGQSLKADRHSGRPRISYHYHELCELVLLRGGSGNRIVGDSFREVHGRDLILVGPALPHGWSVSGEQSAAEDEVEFVVALFTRESIGLELLAKPEFAPVSGLIDRAGRGLAWSADAAHDVEERLFDLPDRDPAMQLLTLLEVLHDLAAGNPAPLVSPDYQPRDVQREHSALAEVLEMIRRRHGENISLAEAARTVHMSVPSFTRFFRRMTGTSFVDHLNEWRIRRACVLLRETDGRIIDVANTCGFSNLSHFNRQFRRRRQTTPRRYRQATREE